MSGAVTPSHCLIMLSQRLFILCFLWFPISSAYLFTNIGVPASWWLMAVLALPLCVAAVRYSYLTSPLITLRVVCFFTRLGFQFFSGILHRQAFTDIKVFILLYGFRKVNAIVIVGAFFICFPYSFGCLDFQSLFCLPPSNERKLFHCSSIGIFLSVSSALSEDKSFSFLISLLK